MKNIKLTKAVKKGWFLTIGDYKENLALTSIELWGIYKVIGDNIKDGNFADIADVPATNVNADSAIVDTNNTTPKTDSREVLMKFVYEVLEEEAQTDEEIGIETGMEKGVKRWINLDRLKEIASEYLQSKEIK